MSSRFVRHWPSAPAPANRVNSGRPSMPSPACIPATLTLDVSALARLAPTGTDAELLAEVKDLLKQVRDRLAAPEPLLVTEKQAGEMLGLSARTVYGMAA